MNVHPGLRLSKHLSIEIVSDALTKVWGCWTLSSKHQTISGLCRTTSSVCLQTQNFCPTISDLVATTRINIFFSVSAASLKPCLRRSIQMILFLFLLLAFLIPFFCSGGLRRNKPCFRSRRKCPNLRQFERETKKHNCVASKLVLLLRLIGVSRAEQSRARISCMEKKKKSGRQASTDVRS